MNGIVVADFEALINNCDIKISDVNESIQKLKSASLELRRSIRNSDLSFLTENLYYDILESSKVMNKLNAYCMALKNILRSYKYQDQKVAAMINRLTP